MRRESVSGGRGWCEQEGPGWEAIIFKDIDSGVKTTWLHISGNNYLQDLEPQIRHGISTYFHFPLWKMGKTVTHHIVLMQST